MVSHYIYIYIYLYILTTTNGCNSSLFIPFKRNYGQKLSDKKKKKRNQNNIYPLGENNIDDFHYFRLTGFCDFKKYLSNKKIPASEGLMEQNNIH